MLKKIRLGLLSAAVAVAGGASISQAALTHRYSFNDGTANDSVGADNGTLMNTATVSGNALQLNNPGLSNPATSANGGYLSLPASIIPASGSVTIESWFTFSGSGFFTEDFTLTNGANDTNPPGASNGQYLMHTISAPQPANLSPTAGGSHIAQSLAGYGNGAETDAYGTTPNIGAVGGGYLDDGESFMAAMVIDGNAGTLSYYLYDISQSGEGGLQQTITAIPLSSYSFTNVYLGRSAFPGDNSTAGSIDEFRVYTDARSADQIAADFAAGPNVVAVPEPASLGIAAVGVLGLLSRRRRA